MKCLKKVIISAIISFSLMMHAKAQCKFSTNEIDDFTGQRNVFLKPAMLAGGITESAQVQIGSIDNNYFLSVSYYAPSVYSIPSESKFYLKTDSGEVIELLNTNATVADPSDNGMGGTTWSANLVFPLSDEVVLKLKEAVITSYRLNKLEGYFQKQVKKKRQVVIQKQMGCLLKELEN